MPGDIAQIFYLLNKKDLVVEWCEKGFEEHDPNMPYIVQIFDGMGDDPRFQEIARKMNLPYKEAAGLRPQFCAAAPAGKAGDRKTN